MRSLFWPVQEPRQGGQALLRHAFSIQLASVAMAADYIARQRERRGAATE